MEKELKDCINEYTICIGHYSTLLFKKPVNLLDDPIYYCRYLLDKDYNLNELEADLAAFNSCLNSITLRLEHEINIENKNLTFSINRL